jgi:hypothetical protein
MADQDQRNAHNTTVANKVAAMQHDIPFVVLMHDLYPEGARTWLVQLVRSQKCGRQRLLASPARVMPEKSEKGRAIP